MRSSYVYAAIGMIVVILMFCFIFTLHSVPCVRPPMGETIGPQMNETCFESEEKIGILRNARSLGG